MHDLCQLVRDFPEGSFFILIAFIWGAEESIKAFAQRNRPIMNCNCECCTDDEEEEEE
jgi:hypothetical protein